MLIAKKYYANYQYNRKKIILIFWVTVKKNQLNIVKIQITF